ncbi:MAG: MBL fold metallo-hydrolase [Clostridia bacterium]
MKKINDETRMVKKDRLKKYALALVFISILVTCIFFLNYESKDSITLTQFSPTTSSQMMGYAIKTSNNKIIIIDGGTKGDTKEIKSYIDSNGSKVDAWILTHPHKDHVGVFENIIQDENIKINKVYNSFYPESFIPKSNTRDSIESEEFYTSIKNWKNNNVIEEVSLNQEINIDNIKIKILGVKNEFITENLLNNSSLVFKVYVNDKSVLFLGDSGIEKGQWLLDNVKDDLKSDYVQMAHHGQAGISEQVYKQINPKFCLWPTPEWLWNNKNGSGTYKTQETKQWMENLNVIGNYVAKDGLCNIKIK